MDFRKLDEKELRELTAFFVVDVVATDEANPTKKELLLALKTAEQPVSDEDYTAFLAAKEKDAAAVAAAVVKPVEKVKEPVEPVDTSNYVLVKYGRNNPRYDIAGHTFTKAHPFKSVDPETAEYLVRNVEGFRLALPSELVEYYN